MSRFVRSLHTLAVCLAVNGAFPTAAHAQRPALPIEPVDVSKAGDIRVQTSVDYAHDTRYPLSGLEGNLWRVGLIRLDVGLSSIAELEIGGGIRDHLAILSRTPAVLSDRLQLTDPSSTRSVDDILVATKINLHREQAGTPGVSVQLGTQLPNANHFSGLGQNTTDFYGRLIAGQSVSSVHITGNIGIGILGDPLQGNRHINSFLYDAMMSRAAFPQMSVIVGVDGRTGANEPGLESRAIGSAGMVWTHGAARIEVDGIVGLTTVDGTFGFRVTAGYTFHAFTP